MVKNLSTEKTQFLHLAAKYKKSNLKVIRLYQELKNKREVARRMDLVESTVTKIVRKKEEIEKLAKDCQKPVDGYVLCNTCTYFA